MCITHYNQMVYKIDKNCFFPTLTCYERILLKIFIISHALRSLSSPKPLSKSSDLVFQGTLFPIPSIGFDTSLFESLMMLSVEIHLEEIHFCLTFGQLMFLCFHLSHRSCLLYTSPSPRDED